MFYFDKTLILSIFSYFIIIIIIKSYKITNYNIIKTIIALYILYYLDYQKNL